MNINPYNFYNYKTSFRPACRTSSVKNAAGLAFKSIPIYRVQVKQLTPDGAYKLVPATFSMLDPDDQDDINALLKMEQKWKHTDHYKFIKKKFLNKKIKNNYFYAVELDNYQLPLSERILSIANAKAFLPNEIVITRLQASPDTLRDKYKKYLNDNEREIKGAGELLMYGVTKLAKRNQKKVVLSSVNNGFFYKLGMSRLDPSDCYYLTFTPENANKFLSNTEKKYNFNPVFKQEFPVLHGIEPC